MDGQELLDDAAGMIAPQSGINILGTFLFTLEVYHAVAHFCVMFRVRMLPKKDLVRLRYYFLIDLLTVASSALFTGELLWLAALQNLQHLYFFVTWNKASYCIKVINWSSLDGVKAAKTESKHEKKSDYDISLGTFFDMAVHITYAYCIFPYIGMSEVVFSIFTLVVLTKLVLFNRKLSWSNPENIPAWVGKRVGSLSKQG